MQFETCSTSKDLIYKIGDKGNSNIKDLTLFINGEEFGNKHFIIYYSPSKAGIYIEDCLQYRCLFIKLVNKIALNRKYLLLLGHLPIVVNVYVEDCHPILKISFLHKLNLKIDKYVFSSQNTKLVTIGRANSNTIVYVNDAISKIHCR